MTLRSTNSVLQRLIGVYLTRLLSYQKPVITDTLLTSALVHRTRRDSDSGIFQRRSEPQYPRLIERCTDNLQAYG